MAVETEGVTIEQLAQKAQAIRTSLGADETTSPTRVESFEREVTRNCDRDFCENPVTYVGMFVDGERATPDAPVTGGREIGGKRWCPSCTDADTALRLKLSAAQNGHLERMADADREEATLVLLERIGANPWEHGHATLDNFDPSESGAKPIARAREFAARVLAARKYEPVRGIYLHGDTGPGKSHIAVGVVRYLIDNGYDPRRIVFDNAAELIAMIQDTYGRREDSTFAVLRKRFDAGLWVCDDFGTERASDDVVRHLTLIFTKRAQRPNLVTSNFDARQLQHDRPEFFRILSRLGPQYFSVEPVRGRDRRFD